VPEYTEESMSQATISLPEVDGVKITLVVDNTVDLLLSSDEIIHRFPLYPDAFDRPAPLAEHGFSALITVERGEKQGTVLFDAGLSPTGILHNLDALEINAAEV
jgi:7,8-dihydropterin-6-yl-methyl-4-(beta-D-ribofuranosyl)aminobenzene 5'-phosphate synthase